MGSGHLCCCCLAARAAEAGSRSGHPRPSLLEDPAQASATACRLRQSIRLADTEPSLPRTDAWRKQNSSHRCNDVQLPKELGRLQECHGS